MTPASARLRELGIELPAVAAPIAAYIPARQHGEAIWTSGQLPLAGGELVAIGKLGGEVTLEQGVEAARIAVLNALAAASQVAGGIDKLRGIHRVVVFVASTPEFTDQAKVANGASELLGEIFKESGSHVRSAVGVPSLPLDAAVEVELIAEV